MNPPSRREALKAMAWAGAGAGALSVLGGCSWSAAAASVGAKADASALGVAETVQGLGNTFLQRAIAAKRLSTAAADLFQNMLSAGTAQLEQVRAAALSGPANTAFKYPDGAFDSSDSILRVGVDIKLLCTQSFLGLVPIFGGAALRELTTSIAFSHGQHRVLLRQLAKASPFADTPFETALTLQQISDSLQVYHA